MNDLLTVKEVASMLRLSMPTIYKFAKERPLTYKRLGDRLMFERADLESFLAVSTVSCVGADK